MNPIFPYIVLLIGLLTSINTQAEPDGVQSQQSIMETVTAYVAQIINLPGEYELSFLPLDDRLNLPQCSTPLETFTATEVIKPGRNTIGVRCTSEKKWSIFTSVIIKNFQEVLVLLQSVARGQVLTEQQLTLERRDVSNLRGDFLNQIEQAVNKQVIRPLTSGSIISVKDLAEPKLIKRGDHVVISSTNPNFSIRMNGIATMDGVKGQLIRVKNQNSGRLIDATVVEPGLVSVDH